MGMFTRETSDDLAKIGEVEGEIREFVHREVIEFRQHQDSDGKMVADNLSSLLQRVSMNSVQELDCLIGELQMLRDRLQHEGERMRREILDYASLNQAAIQSAKSIMGNLKIKKDS